VNQRLSLNKFGKTYGGKPRSEPDSGKPTVRDRKGALGNTGHGRIRDPYHNRKSGYGNSLPKVLCAQFYPTPQESAQGIYLGRLQTGLGLCGVASTQAPQRPEPVS
jgi:hypothetical protein